MANPDLIVQLQQLAGQLNALWQTVGNLQASNTFLTTRIATLEAENTTLTPANMTLMTQVLNLSGGTAAGSAAGGGTGTTPGIAGGGAGAAPLVTQTRVQNWLHPCNYLVWYVGADSVCTQQKNGPSVCSLWYV